MFSGRVLIIIGVLLTIVGVLIVFFPKLPFPGQLPGDITVKKGNIHFYFPIVSCILISLLLSLLVWFFQILHKN